MPITRTSMVDDDGSGTTGTIINNAWKQELYGQIDGYPAWTDIAFSAGNFFGSGSMVWTVGSAAVIRNRYAINGRLLHWSFYLSWFSGSNVLSGTPGASLRMAAPPGFNLAVSQAQVVDFCAGVAGAAAVGGLYVNVNSAGFIDISKAAGGNFALSDIPGMTTTIVLEVT